MSNYEIDRYTCAGHTVVVEYDDWPEAPWNVNDDGPHCYTLSGDRRAKVECNEVYEHVPELTREQIKSNITDIKRELDVPTLLRGVSHVKHHHYDGVEAVNDALREIYEGAYNSDKLPLLQAMWEWKGWMTYRLQRESAEVLVVDSELPEATLRTFAKEYASWMLGEVYCFSLLNYKGDVIDDIGSFIGEDWEKSGLIEEAQHTAERAAAVYFQKMMEDSDMRKIERDMLEAVRAQNTYHCNNTEVRQVDEETAEVRLHGHLIARVLYGNPGYVIVPSQKTLAEYPTVTTMSRLHALGVDVQRTKNKVYLNGQYVADAR